MNFYGTLCAFLEYFLKKKNSSRFRRTHNETLLQNYYLYYLMKHGESDVQWHICIQGIHLSAFGSIFGKEKEALTYRYAMY